MNIKQIIRILLICLFSASFFTCSEPDTPSSTEATALTVTPHDVTLAVGEQATLNVEVTPTNAAVRWTSADESVASLKEGVITALKEGETEFLATSGALTARVAVSVTAYKPETFPRKVLVESFTGIGCGACEMVADPFYHSFFSVPDVASQAVFLSVFYGFSTTFSLPEFKVYRPYWGDVGATFNPGLMLNRLPIGLTPDAGSYKGKQIPMIRIIDYASPKKFRNELWSKVAAKPAIVSLQIKSLYDVATKQLSAEISGKFAKEALSSGRKYYITVLTKEDGIKNPKPIRVEILDNVVNAILTDIQGNPIEIKADGTYLYTTKAINYTGDPQKSKVVAFINSYEKDICNNEVYNAQEVPMR